MRARAGESGVDELLTRAEDPRPASVIEDERTWSTYSQKIALFEAAAQLLNDSDVSRHMGEAVLETQVAGPVKMLLRALGSPGQVLRNVARAVAKFSTNADMEALEVGRRQAVLSYRLHEPGVPHRLDCLYNIGILSQVGPLFGLPPATVRERACQVEGDERCIYEVRWNARRRWFRSAIDEAELASLNARAEQFEALQSTAADLVSTDDVDTVLSRIAERAATAVRAPRFLLAVAPVAGLSRRVLHDGFTDSEADELAAALIAGEFDGESEASLVVEVSSARCSYGRLLVGYETGHAFFPEERRLLDAYGRYAAAALDAAVALEDSRRQGAEALALLGLSRNLSESVTPLEVAERLAHAVPMILGSEHATVFFWDEGEGRLEFAASVGWSSALQRILKRFSVTPEDTPEMKDWLRDPAPGVLRPNHPDGFLAGSLSVFATGVALFAPLMVRGQVLGVVSASWSDPKLHATEEHLLSRLSGVADQAASALQNTRLLEQARRQALTDALTELPNQILFDDRFGQAVAAARRLDRKVAVCFLDLDRFKRVNDSLGHGPGNELLKQVAARLEHNLRAGDTVARLGGDEFAVLLPGLREIEDASAVTDKVVAAFRRPFVLDGTQVFVTVSVGVAVYPDHGETVDEVVRNADAAMYRAKSRGRDRVEIYGPDMEQAASARVTLESDLHDALTKTELFTHYQPIVSLESDLVVGVEALVRWQHPTLGVLGPERFIPLAEETGLVIGVDRWVLGEACRIAAEWRDQGIARRVAVNLSALHFSADDLVNVISDALALAGLPADRLELEITESMAVRETGRASRLLADLSDLGVQIAIDDFGTGYSILGSLRDFPVQRVKIDRSFVAGIGAEADDGPIVAAIIEMAHSLGLKVTAEGVETNEQLSFLRSHGCDEVQGFLLGRPVPASELPVLPSKAAPLPAS